MFIAPLSLTDTAHKILSGVLSKTSELEQKPGVDRIYYRVEIEKNRATLDALEKEGFVKHEEQQRYLVTLKGLTTLRDKKAKKILETCRKIFFTLKEYYKKNAKKPVTVSELTADLGLASNEVITALVYFRDAPIGFGGSTDLTQPSASVHAGESILDYPDLDAAVAKLWEWHSQNQTNTDPLVYRESNRGKISKRTKKKSVKNQHKKDTGTSIVAAALVDVPAPINQDALEYQVYSSAIVDFLVHKNTKAPFSLAITGTWGSGKTTLLRWIRDEIKKRNYPTVWFSPWKHNQHDEVWASFARVITESLVTSTWDKFKLRWERIKKTFPSQQTRWLSIGIAIAITLCVLIGYAIVGVEFLYGLFALFLPAIPFLLSFWKGFRSPLLRMLDSTKGPDYDRILGFKKEFEDDLSRVIEIAATTDKPLFIFVDDLDRAPPPIPVKLLEAMNILIGQERCIFVIGLDLAIVGASIEAQYLPVIQRIDQNAGGFSGADFIEKLIQLEFTLPRLTDRQLDTFLDVLLQQNRSEKVITKSIKISSPSQAEATITHTTKSEMKPSQVDQPHATKFDEDSKDFIQSIYFYCRAIPRNPRKIKRFINQYRLVAYIADRRGLFASGRVDLEGLGASVVLAAEYPEIYKLLSTENFQDKFLNIMAWLKHQSRGMRQISDDDIKSYGMSANREEYRHISILLSKMMNREKWVEDYLSLSAVVTADNPKTNLDFAQSL